MELYVPDYDGLALGSGVVLGTSGSVALAHKGDTLPKGDVLMLVANAQRDTLRMQAVTEQDAPPPTPIHAHARRPKGEGEPCTSRRNPRRLRRPPSAVVA